MVDHLSPLVFDTVAAGLPYADTARTHLESCEVCRSKLDAVKAERSATMMSLRFAAGLKKIAPPPVRSMPSWARPVIGLALAACLIALVSYRFFTPNGDGTILKAGATVEVLKDGTTPVTRAKVGDKVALAVGGAGYRQVAVFVVSDQGVASVLFPWAPLQPGAQVPVGKGFDVTPGSSAVFACFDDHPDAIEGTLAELTDGVGKTVAGKNLSPLDTPPPKLSHGLCVKTRLEVIP